MMKKIKFGIVNLVLLLLIMTSAYAKTYDDSTVGIGILSDTINSVSGTQTYLLSILDYIKSNGDKIDTNSKFFKDDLEPKANSYAIDLTVLEYENIFIPSLYQPPTTTPTTTPPPPQTYTSFGDITLSLTYLDMPEESSEIIHIGGDGAYRVHHCISEDELIATCSVSPTTPKILTVEGKNVDDAKITNILLMDVNDDRNTPELEVEPLATKIQTRVYPSLSVCSSVNLEMSGKETIVVGENRIFTASLFPKNCETEFEDIRYELKVDGVTRMLNFLDPEFTILEKFKKTDKTKVRFNKIQGSEENYGIYVEAFKGNIAKENWGTIFFTSDKTFVKVVNTETEDSILISGPDNMDPGEQMKDRWTSNHLVDWYMKAIGLNEVKLEENSTICCGQNHLAPAGRYFKEGVGDVTRSSFNLIAKKKVNSVELSASKKIFLSTQQEKKLTVLVVSNLGEVPIKDVNVAVESVGAGIDETKKTGGNGKASFSIPVGSNLNIKINGFLEVQGYGMPNQADIKKIVRDIGVQPCSGVIITNGEELYLNEGEEKVLKAKITPVSCDATDLEYTWKKDHYLKVQGTGKELKISSINNQEGIPNHTYTFNASYKNSDIHFVDSIDVFWGEKEITLDDFWISGTEMVDSGGNFVSDDWVLNEKDSPVKGNWYWDSVSLLESDKCCKGQEIPNSTFKLIVNFDSSQSPIEKEIKVNARDTVTFTIKIKDEFTGQGLENIDITLEDINSNYKSKQITTSKSGKAKFDDVPKGGRININYYNKGTKQTKEGYEALSDKDIELVYKRGPPCTTINIYVKGNERDLFSVKKEEEFELNAVAYPNGCDAEGITYEWKSTNQKGILGSWVYISNFDINGMNKEDKVRHSRSKSGTYLYTVEAKYKKNKAWEDTITIFVDEDEQKLDDYWIEGPDKIKDLASQFGPTTKFGAEFWFLADKKTRKAITTNWAIIHNGKVESKLGTLGCCSGSIVPNSGFRLEAEVGGKKISKEIELKPWDTGEVSLIVNLPIQNGYYTAKAGEEINITQMLGDLNSGLKLKELFWSVYDGKNKQTTTDKSYAYSYLPMGAGFITISAEDNGNEVGSEIINVLDICDSHATIGSIVVKSDKNPSILIVSDTFLDDYSDPAWSGQKIMEELPLCEDIIVSAQVGDVTKKKTVRLENSQTIDVEFLFASATSEDCQSDKDINLTLNKEIMEWTLSGHGLCGSKCYQKGDIPINPNSLNKATKYCCDGDLKYGNCDGTPKMEIVDENGKKLNHVNMQSGETREFAARLTYCDKGIVEFSVEDKKNIKEGPSTGKKFTFSADEDIKRGSYTLKASTKCDNEVVIVKIPLDIEISGDINLVVDLNKKDGVYTALPGRDVEVYTSGDVKVTWELMKGTRLQSSEDTPTSRWKFKAPNVSTELTIKAKSLDGINNAEEKIKVLSKCENREREGIVKVDVANSPLIDDLDITYLEDGIENAKRIKMGGKIDNKFIDIPLCTNLKFIVKSNGVSMESSVLLTQDNPEKTLDFNFDNLEEECHDVTPSTGKVLFDWGKNLLALCEGKCVSEKSDYKSCCDNKLSKNICERKMELVDENGNSIQQVVLKSGESKIFKVNVYGCSPSTVKFKTYWDDKDEKTNTANDPITAQYLFTAPGEEGESEIKVSTTCSNGDYISDSTIIKVIGRDELAISVPTNVDIYEKFPISVVGGEKATWIINRKKVELKVNDILMSGDKKTTFIDKSSLELEALSSGEIEVTAVLPNTGVLGTNLFNQKDPEKIIINDECSSRLPNGEIEGQINGLTYPVTFTYSYDGTTESGSTNLTGGLSIKDIPFCTDITISASGNSLTKTARSRSIGPNDIGFVTLDFKDIKDLCNALAQSSGKIEFTTSNNVALCGDTCYSKDALPSPITADNAYCCGGVNNRNISGELCVNDDWCADPTDPKQLKVVGTETCKCGDEKDKKFIAFCGAGQYCYKPNKDKELKCYDEVQECELVKFGTGILDPNEIKSVTEICGCGQGYCAIDEICYEDKKEFIPGSKGGNVCTTKEKKEEIEEYLKTNCKKETGISEKEVCVCEKQKGLYNRCEVDHYCRDNGKCEEKGDACIMDDLRCDDNKLYKCKGLLSGDIVGTLGSQWKLDKDCSDDNETCLLTRQHELGGELVWDGGCFSDKQMCKKSKDMTVWVNTASKMEVTVEISRSKSDCADQLKDKILKKSGNTENKRVSFKFADIPLGEYTIKAYKTDDTTLKDEITHSLAEGDQSVSIELLGLEEDAGCRENLVINNFDKVLPGEHITDVELITALGITHPTPYKGSGTLAIPHVLFKHTEGGEPDKYTLNIYYDQGNRRYRIPATLLLEKNCTAQGGP